MGITRPLLGDGARTQMARNTDSCVKLPAFVTTRGPAVMETRLRQIKLRKMLKKNGCFCTSRNGNDKLVDIGEAIEVCKDRTMWKSIVSVYPSGKQATSCGRPGSGLIYSRGRAAILVFDGRVRTGKRPFCVYRNEERFRLISVSVTM
ncbi:hypothetical protein EVAR_84322_1 [Eumeta japonica]|uniref:Uncharacterized protein n=1 Tax=Eumeta variegata TaxID=151549 RepID=A0A4C1U4I0_EUMVA|nr:hypothetical protein EVAR_84322_1 [Eumeta japonica]